MQKVTSRAEFDVSTQSPRLTVAVFKADWCSDCKFLDPFMPEIDKRFANDLTLVEVDVEEVEDISQDLNILGIPSFVAFSDGRELSRFVNKNRKSREEIEEYLNNTLEIYRSIHK
ncbi:thioredoxin family protein [Paenibacillus pini]|uniref:Thioredoxin n=1 Tax=Paenibacillus pini JCM 16418 TaxID=1236976 RepID=W7Z2H6_9BACL|nr:thioredoxin family protein [Paenibacillus pini]GAF08604.1 thioredoxin [Paenibacillus pini JCM 16418]